MEFNYISYIHGRKTQQMLELNENGELIGKKGEWTYCDTNEIVYLSDTPKPCPKCNLAFIKSNDDWVDPCLGVLPGIDFACCGHGVEQGYLSFQNGRIIRFNPKIQVQEWSGDDENRIHKTIVGCDSITRLNEQR